MKTIPIALEEHYESRATSTALLWRIVRRDGLVFLFTDHDFPIPFAGEVYLTSSGFTGSAVKSKADMSVDNLETIGMLSEEGISREDIEAGRWDGARVELRRVNWKNPAGGAEKVRFGTLGKCKPARGQYVVELRGLLQALQANIGEVVTPNCNADFGDARCLFDVEALRVSGVIEAAADRRTFLASGLDEADGFYDRGEVLIEGGLNDGVRMEVREHTASSDGATIELQLPLPFAPTPGDAFSIIPGCDKSKPTCKDRWSNLVHFRGFSFVPGPDSALQIGGQ